MTDEQPGGTQRFIGLALMVIAGLWIAFCGLCAVGMLGSGLISGELNGEALGLALIVLFISGLGAAGGYAIFVTGRSLRGK